MPTSDQKSCHRAPNATDYLELPRSELKSCRSVYWSCHSLFLDCHAGLHQPERPRRLLRSCRESSNRAAQNKTELQHHQDRSVHPLRPQELKTGLSVLLRSVRTQPVCSPLQDRFAGTKQQQQHQ